MTDLSWHIEKRRISELQYWDLNPRKITDEHLERLKQRIIARGFHDVLKIDIDNTILSGNQRKKILLDLGVVEIDCIVPSRKLTEEERRAVGLESNRNDGEWDWKGLSDFDEDLLKSIGFSATEIDRTFNLKTEEDEFDAAKEAEQITNPVSQSGDVYALGRHRLMCGDSTKEEDVSKLLNGELADLIFTDPPYMVDYKSQSGRSYNSSAFGGDGKKIFNDNLDDEKALQFYVDVLTNLYKFSKDFCPIYWWYANNKRELINQIAFLETGWKVSQIIMWLKTSMVFSQGQDYHRCYEPCMYGWKKGKKRYCSKEIANFKDTWMQMSNDDFQDQMDIWLQKRDVTQNYVHPTQKPVQLAERALRKSSKQDDIVLDLFGGSGSTLMACEQMHRRGYLMELDPKFCDVIVKRWERFTGDKAEKYEHGNPTK